MSIIFPFKAFCSSPDSTPCSAYQVVATEPRHGPHQSPTGVMLESHLWGCLHWRMARWAIVFLLRFELINFRQISWDMGYCCATHLERRTLVCCRICSVVLCPGGDPRTPEMRVLQSVSQAVLGPKMYLGQSIVTTCS